MKIIEKIELLRDEALKISSDGKTISEQDLKALIAKTMGFDPRTINNYIHYLEYFKFMEKNERGFWIIKV